MKLTKAKLIKLVKSDLEKLGFIEFKDSTGSWQGLFCKKIRNELYLTLGLTIHRYYECAFTADYYLSKTTLIGAVWGDIPKGIYERPSFILTDKEREVIQLQNMSKDIWFDSSDEKSVSDFLRMIKITEQRFINQPELIKEIEQSEDVKILSENTKTVKNLANNGNVIGVFKFLPSKEVDGIPMNWFKASEKVLHDTSGVLSLYTVKSLAADAYRQYLLDNGLI
ncbi:MAG: hypothetical protein IPM69_00150 [Ignavibacteria bacterium]|nr:hypothetical protein [Ignavibacteria bacterium]